ncbi:signal-regulatory protein beta-2-like [Mugil cephalus]|uniref:signal-regulatory protein beta-2-like n=1 Tax=Mugil cephalus TaxID=48193 RepID=UPI001FB7E437|nr:signal-regulatory protein beta-2-like [Mugil cephalus]
MVYFYIIVTSCFMCCMISLISDTLTPVIPVELGEAATLTCALSNTETTRKEIHWYKQTVPDTLKSIVKFQKSVPPKYAPEFSNSRWKVHNDNNFSNLTISRITQEDEGLYHCGISEWLGNTEWSGTYLLVKGNTERTSNYTVVQTVSGSVRPGDSVTLQCSVLSDSENKTCPGDLSVLWFRDGSQKSPLNIVYTEGKTHYECEKRSNSQKRCGYSFSKDVSSSDAGTYYCAVATCGEILFGNGTKLQFDQAASSEFPALVIAVICLTISVIVHFVFICYQTPSAVCEQYDENTWSKIVYLCK